MQTGVQQVEWDDLKRHLGEPKKEDDYEDSSKEKIPYPTQIFYIISMEACERFSYYGMNGKES